VLYVCARVLHRIELGDLLVIAEIHTGVDAHQLARMPRVVSLAEAALAAPFARLPLPSSKGLPHERAGERERFPTLHEKAAVYCSRIVRYHPLPDGNKRTAYDVMREFVERNGAAFVHPPQGLDATAQAIEELAANALGEADFIAWMKARLTM
jgi:death on curing protein